MRADSRTPTNGYAPTRSAHSGNGARGNADSVPGAALQVRVERDFSRRVSFVSDGVARLFERPAEWFAAALAGDDGPTLPEDRPAFWDALERSRLTRSPWTVDFRAVTGRTNRLVWLRLWAVPTEMPDNAVVWNGVLSDITEQLLAAEALRDSEARYRLLTENATDMIARLSPAGLFLYVSPAARTLFGAAPTDFLGRHLDEFLHADDRPRVLEALDRLLAGKTADLLRHRLCTQEGVYVWCESTIKAVRDAAWTLREFVVVTRGIEERRRFDLQVQHALKMEAVSRLAAGIAHDFNNLLTVINGYSEMIALGLARPDVDRLAAQVAEIRHAGARAGTLTQQLLAFAQQQTQTLSRVDLNALVTAARPFLERLAGPHVRVTTELCPDLAGIEADVEQLQLMLTNLVRNACAAMPNGGALTIRTDNAEFLTAPGIDVPPGHYVMLGVRDTGVGMGPDTQARVFEPFFTTKEAGCGVGLGLATVHGIVKQSGGHVEVESAPGLGTTFRVFLPRAVAPSTDNRGEPTPTMVPARATVLLVEDDDSVRHVTASMLRSLGYRVVEAAGGPQAVQLCHEHSGPIDVLLVDVVMPVMSGREVAERVRSARPGVHTVFMSGYADDAPLRNEEQNSSTAFVAKPFTCEALGRQLRDVLGNR